MNIIRFFFLRSQYRKPQEFTEGLLEESKTTFNRISEIVRDVESNPSELSIIEMFKNSMNDDLNTPKFLGEVFEKIKVMKELSHQDEKKLKETIKYIFEVLGFNFENIEQIEISNEKLNSFFNKFKISYQNIDQAMDEYLIQREEFRKNKNFTESDTMRDQLKEIGILIKDGEESGWYWEGR